MNDIQSKAAAGKFRYRFFQSKARQEQELQQLRFGEFLSDGASGEMLLNDRGADTFEIDAGTVIGDGDQQDTGAMPGLEAEGTLGRFAGSATRFRSFTTMVDGVAQQVGQRGFQPFEDITIDLSAFSRDVESDRFAKRASEVANHAGEPADPVAKGPHPGAQHLKVKSLRQLCGAAVEQVQFLGAVAQKLLRVGELTE